MNLKVRDNIPPRFFQTLSHIDFSLTHNIENKEIVGLLNRTVLNGGKRVRPLLMMILGDFFNVEHLKLLPYAKITEYVHAASLAHDDVIDQAETRRNRPTINIMSSNKKAVLAGDYLLSDVMQMITVLGPNELIIELSKTIQSLVKGEWQQIENSQKNRPHFEDIERVAINKTGYLMGWCCVVPYVLSDFFKPSFLEKVREIGILMGLIFQYTDDILDFSKSSTGKKYHQDLENGLLNSVSHEILKFYPEYNKDDLLKLFNDQKISSEIIYKSVMNVKNRAKSLIKQVEDLLDLIYQKIIFPSHPEIPKSTEILKNLLYELLERTR